VPLNINLSAIKQQTKKKNRKIKQQYIHSYEYNLQNLAKICRCNLKRLIQVREKFSTELKAALN
jgi:hypothetical protein